jgi:hypothetical protein
VPRFGAADLCRYIPPYAIPNAISHMEARLFETRRRIAVGWAVLGKDTRLFIPTAGQAEIYKLLIIDNLNY